MIPTVKSEVPISQKMKAGLKKSDYMLVNISDKELIKLPNSVRGQAFQLDSLNNCMVWLMDYFGQVQIVRTSIDICGQLQV